MSIEREVKGVVITRAPRPDATIFERLQYAAACKLCIYREHTAASGSIYVTIDHSLVIRFSDHECSPDSLNDFEFIDRAPCHKEFQEILSKINYPYWCDESVFAAHVGLTVSQLKVHLTPACYEEVDEESDYYDAFLGEELVVVARALEILDQSGISQRIPVRQEIYTEAFYPCW